MIVVVIVCLLAVVGLAVALWRFQQHIDELSAERDDLASELDSADNEVTEALAATVAAEKARDDALERVQRSRRDAAEVAKRLAEESAARAGAEARLSELSGELDRATAENAELRDQLDAAGPSVDVDRLWALALADVERTWRMSVASGPDAVSPLGDSNDPLRTAVEIEVDAAREEAGAAIELDWRVEDVVTPAEGVVVLATVRQLIASVAKTASSALLTVTSSGDGVEVGVDARDDDDAPIVIDLAGTPG